MKKTQTAKLVVLFESDLPNMASHCPQSDCGFSLYKGVLIQWDEDQDERILKFIDLFPDAIRSRLLVAQEHEASVALLWKDSVPAGYREGAEWQVDGDIWHVTESLAAD